MTVTQVVLIAVLGGALVGAVLAFIFMALWLSWQDSGRDTDEYMKRYLLRGE